MPNPCDCRSSGNAPYAAAGAALIYGGAPARAIVRFKHSRRREQSRGLAHILVPSLVFLLKNGIDIMLPVPLHPSRLRARGFNQSLDLIREARAISRREFPALRWPDVRPDTLWRVLDTPFLGTHSPDARRKIMAAAITARGDVRGLSCLVVDDVMTTGATFAACASALRGAGAARVYVAALARAI